MENKENTHGNLNSIYIVLFRINQKWKYLKMDYKSFTFVRRKALWNINNTCEDQKTIQANESIINIYDDVLAN